MVDRLDLLNMFNAGLSNVVSLDVVLDWVTDTVGHRGRIPVGQLDNGNIMGMLWPMGCMLGCMLLEICWDMIVWGGI